MDTHKNLHKVELDAKTIDYTDAEISRERHLVLYDLSQDGFLCPVEYENAPNFLLIVGIENGKLKLDFIDEEKKSICFIISFSPYIGFIREYKDICDSYKYAVLHDNMSKIETIDMARRGLHNQAADLIKERLSDKIKGNHVAFRHLFTLMTLLVYTK